jgi:hypothetical protein
VVSRITLPIDVHIPIPKLVSVLPDMAKETVQIRASELQILRDYSGYLRGLSGLMSPHKRETGVAESEEEKRGQKQRSK